MGKRRVRIGTDTGGTFTDVVAVDEETGASSTTKTPSTPADPAEGFLTGVRKVLDQLGLPGEAGTAGRHRPPPGDQQPPQGTRHPDRLLPPHGHQAPAGIAP